MIELMLALSCAVFAALAAVGGARIVSEDGSPLDFAAVYVLAMLALGNAVALAMVSR